MANFYLYKYDFIQSQERELFSEDGTHLDQIELNKQLYALLSPAEGAKMTLDNLYGIKTSSNGESEPDIYDNEILRYWNGIVMIRIRNNRTKIIIPKNSKDEQKIGHYPFCWVIIDTRPESQAILVQQNAAFPNPDKVVDILQNYFIGHLSLSRLGWTMNLMKRKCKGVIWDIVRTRTNGNKDRVSELSFKFTSKRQPTGDNRIDNYCKDALHFFSSEEGELKLYSKDSTSKMLDETNEDLKRTVNLLIDNQYKIKVGFERSGSYEYGKDAFAIYGIDDIYCNAFENNSTELFGNSSEGLAAWLDKIIPEDDSTEYTEPGKSNRRRRNARTA